jgi:FHA domain
MAFYLKVIGGADDGTSHRVDAGDVVVGKAPTAKIQLRDETIAWEHVVVKDAGSRLVVVNLAAAGTKVRGKRITEETRVSSGEEIVLSGKVKMIVENRSGAAAGGLGKTGAILVALVLLLVVGMGATFILTREKPTEQQPITDANWRQAYNAICMRLEKWADEGRMQREVLVAFQDAWRYEQVGNNKAAWERWNKLQSVLNGLKAPNSKGVGPARISEAAGPTFASLGLVMGWDSALVNSEASADSDETLADALVWFVRKKTEILGRQLKD